MESMLIDILFICMFAPLLLSLPLIKKSSRGIMIFKLTGIGPALFISEVNGHLYPGRHRTGEERPESCRQSSGENTAHAIGIFKHKDLRAKQNGDIVLIFYILQMR